jgi:protein arginine N-methyltransferase 1
MCVEVIEWELTRDVNIRGFCIWWTAELVPGVELTTSPFAPLTHWEQAYLPLMRPLPCRARDHLLLDLRYRSSIDEGVSVQWNVGYCQSGSEQMIAAESNVE